MLGWLKRIRWPWQRRAASRAPAHTAEALRRLYLGYQRQRRGWGYVVISAISIASLFIMFSLFAEMNLWVLILPLIALLFAIFQIRRSGDLVRVLRQALTMQRQIDRKRAEAEQAAAEEEEKGREAHAARQARARAAERAEERGEGNGRARKGPSEGGREGEGEGEK